MAKRSKLLAALDAHRGKDYKLEKQKKLQKQAASKKKSNPRLQSSDPADGPIGGTPIYSSTLEALHDSEGWESDESEDATTGAIDTSRLDDSDGSSEGSLGGQDPTPQLHQRDDLQAPTQLYEADEDDEDDKGIPISDIESLPSEELADIIPHQRLTINNTAALLKAQKSIALPISTLAFSEHQTITTTAPVSIPDIDDDLTRELAFYKQCLDAADEAINLQINDRLKIKKPNDYFAEMVKSDEHMVKIKHKMTEEAANKKASAEARKQRDLKRFGKQVQIAKLQERDKAKRDMLGKIDILKRKRKNADTPGPTNEEDLFDVALEDATKADKTSKPSRNGHGSAGDRPTKRRKKDEKFGFGGKKRFSKSGDALSSGDLKGLSAKAMKGTGAAKPGAKRLGKSRRNK